VGYREELWQAFSDRNAPRALEILKVHHELVNDVSERGEHVFKEALSFQPDGDALVKFIATSSHFNIAYVRDTGATGIDDITTSTNPVVLGYFIDNPAILVNRNKLTYATVSADLDSAKSAYNKLKQKDPNSEQEKTRKYEAKIERLTTMLSMIREATIRYALATDDPTWLQRLSDAYCILGSPISDKTSDRANVFSLAKTQGKENINAWQEKRTSHSSSATILAELQTASPAFQKAAQDVTQLQSQKLQEEAAVLKGLHQSQRLFLNKVAEIVGEAPSIGPSPIAVTS